MRGRRMRETSQSPITYSLITHSLFPNLNYQLPITNYQLPITNYQLPITNYQLPITNYQLPMGLFDFLENRLDEFLRNNPHLELQALEEQLRQQEEDTLRLIAQLQRQEKKLQEDILNTAKEVQLWHSRIDKAKAANRLDLAHAAQEREASLLRQGNQQWGQMKGSQERAEKAKELYRQIQVRRKEVQAKYAEAEANRNNNPTEQQWDTSGWNQKKTSRTGNQFDTLDEQFKRLEMNDELEEMKRNLSK